ncbi:PAS domain-containing hybrid sensor histidine kinase/response regulator [Fundidesulfovibrio agrisoli]|uniref:PAS domain-containing hybrid sensor histidine kinase/response regulator n=1 Tax=Fundidesulfovibrio agrisoli TaxID=2922717 RepID=UPI001FAC9139|nr:PAS domain-containing hybrid sensor histidine kinase/response regulator [Fundidesulfovibrio agrisoli]
MPHADPEREELLAEIEALRASNARLESELRSIRSCGPPPLGTSANHSPSGTPESREALYRAMLRNLPVDFWARDLSQRIIMQSQESLRLWGDLSEASPADLRVDPAVREAWRDNNRRVFAGETVTSRKEYALPLGGRRTFHEVATPIVDQGRMLGIMGLNIDVTAARLAQEALRVSETRFRNIVESVRRIAIQGYDEQRRVILWNEASEEIYGYTKDEALGRRLEDLIIPGPMREGVVQAVTDWVERGVPIPPGELVLRHKDGHAVPVYSSHVMQRGPEGSKEMYCIDVDLSEIHRMNLELKEAKEQAEAASRSKSEFLANMSHEVRTPLNGILGMLQLLQTTALDGEQADYVRTGIAASERLARLLTDILDLSRIESNRLNLEMTNFRMGGVTEPIRDLFRHEARRKGLELRIEVSENLPAWLTGDEHRLRQVLFNLVGNALKFTESGHVVVEVYPGASWRDGCGHESSRVVFTVRDTGIGMPEEKISSLFQPFTQVSQSYVRAHQGAGLGLAIVKRLVSMMSGNVAIESEQGRGTAVHVSLPLRAGVPQAGEARLTSIHDAAPRLPEGLRVLLVEDERVNRVAMRRMLEKEGCLVLEARNGAEALSALTAGGCQLVLMDIQMPVMDGLEATRAIRGGETFKTQARVPIVALTAYAMTGDREKFLDAGMDAYLSKPVRMEELRRVVAKVLEGRGAVEGLGISG